MKRIKFFLTKMFGQQKIGAEKGFTLAEIMVTAGIVAVLAVAIMRMNQMAQKTAKTTAQSLEVTQLQGFIQQILIDPLSCTETFKNAVPTITSPGASITKIVRRVKNDNQDVVGAGDICVTNTTRPGGTSPCISGVGTQGRVGIYRMYLRKTTAAAPDGGVIGELEIHFAKGAGANASWDFGAADKKKIHSLSSYGSNYAVKKIQVNLALNAGGAVVACYTTQENYLKEACENLGGNYNTALSPVCALPIPNDLDAACTMVALTAVGTTSYTGIALGTSAQTCPAGTVLRGIKLLTTAGGEAAEIEGNTIRFSNLTLTMKCCPYKPAR